MKKLYIFILFMLLSTSIFAQWTGLQRKALADSFAVRDATLDSLGIEISSLGDLGVPALQYGKFFIGDINNNAAGRTISGDFTINYLGVGTISTGIIMNADISNSAQIDPTKIASLGLGISATEFSMLDNARSNLQQQIDDINVGTGYLLLTGDQTVSGDNGFTGESDFSLGTVLIPYKSSYTPLAGGGRFFNYSDGTIMFQTKNSNNDKFDLVMASTSWAITYGLANYIKSTGTDTVTSTILFNGTLNAANGNVLIGEKPETPVTNEINGSTSQGESGLWWNGLRIPDEDGVDDIVAQNYTYNLPEVITNGDDTLNFTNDRNFVKSVMTVAADNNLNLYFANSGYGNITILIIGGWNPSGTINWNTTIAGETLKWVGGTEPPLDTSTSDQVFTISFMKVTSALIIGQWNWAE